MKKDSTDSTNVSSTKKFSLYEYYDEELDITVLSNSDDNDEPHSEIVLSMEQDYCSD